MEPALKTIIAYSPTIPAAVIPFFFVFRRGSLGWGLLLSWVLLVLGYAALSFGLPAIGGVKAVKWVPEATGMLPIIFLGLPFAMIVVAVAGVARVIVRWLRRRSENRNVPSSQTNSV